MIDSPLDGYHELSEELKNDLRKRFSKKKDGLQACWGYSPEKYCWAGVIAHKKGTEITFLNVGVELTREAIMQWCAEVYVNRELGKPYELDPPDMTGRRQ